VEVYGGGAGRRRAMLEHKKKKKKKMMMMKKKNRVMQQQVGVGAVAKPSLPLNFMRVNKRPAYEFEVLFFFLQKNTRIPDGLIVAHLVECFFLAHHGLGS
jgi:hypothetical protein